MRPGLREKLTYANVMATLAVFIALGGASYAAFTLPKNSVGPKQLRKSSVTKQKLRKSAVTTPKIANDAVTGAKVLESSLGTVPAATTAGTANTAGTADLANSLAPAEDWHEVGAPGEPGFLNSWHNNESTTLSETAAFYKDQTGVVQLKGLVTGGSASQIFRLPPGYRPAGGKLISPIISCVGGIFCGSGVSSGGIRGSGLTDEGIVSAPPGATLVGLDGVSFRAES